MMVYYLKVGFCLMIQLLGETFRSFFPVSREDEERVVDADSQPHHRDDVWDELVELDKLPDDPGEAHGGEYRDDGQDDGYECRDHGAEYQRQDDDRDSDADHLAGEKVVLGKFHESNVDAGVADHQELEAVDRELLGDVGHRIP